MEQSTINRVPRQEDQLPKASLTRHAWRRMTSRGISSAAVEAALAYGRTVYARGAAINVIGRKEVEQFGRMGINLSAFEGVQVVCSPDGAVMTTYRNRDFRGLRASHRKSTRR